MGYRISWTSQFSQLVHNARLTYVLFKLRYQISKFYIGTLPYFIKYHLYGPLHEDPICVIISLVTQS